jgi:hypothetical protein
MARKIPDLPLPTFPACTNCGAPTELAVNVYWGDEAQPIWQCTKCSASWNQYGEYGEAFEGD